MIQITQLKLRPDQDRGALAQAAARKLGIRKEDILSWKIIRQSVDARRRPDIYFVYTLHVEAANEKKVLQKVRRDPQISQVKNQPYRFPETLDNARPLTLRPVIVGSGPAGLFCALLLARSGYRPVIIERGADVEKRTKIVEHFWESGQLDSQTNVQFGEGGAGTFSDGKLHTGIGDRSGRIPFILETFAHFGADPDICFHYQPHVGTDVLREVLAGIRHEIESFGGTYEFETRLCQIEEGSDGTWILQTEKNGKKETRRAQVVVLATGHSAPDTYRLLQKAGLSMEAKPFAVGVRCEHPQQMINEAQYGKDCPYLLDAASYKLTHQADQDRGVFSFCMCPGGYVVNASSREGELAVNGMSYHGRAGINANSAIVVSVRPEDFPGDPADPLRGLTFVSELEQRAYRAAGGKVPVQLLGDFTQNRMSEKLGDVTPQIKGAWAFANLRPIFPSFVADSLDEAFAAFEKTIPHFARPDALLEAVESRTSSPVRIRRTETLEAPGFPGIYPCGEGAGYAGGITSAAADGMRVAEKIKKVFMVPGTVKKL